MRGHTADRGAAFRAVTALVGMALVAIAIASFTTPSAKAQPATTIAQVAPDGLLVGAVVHGVNNDWDQAGPYRATAKQHFNAITATTYMGWGGFPETFEGSGVYEPNTVDLRRVIDWAQPELAVHGHALVYPLSNKDLAWYQALPIGAHEAELKRYVEALVRAGDGQVEVWDVVNEAFGDPGNEANDPVDPVTGLRNSYKEYISIGEDYIDKAFEWADAVDPDVQLIINDYGTEEWNTKSTRLLDYIVKMRDERDVPIDGVGFQMHLWASRGEPDWVSIRANFQRFADAGFDLYITELDVPIIETTDPASRAPTAAELERQRTFYEEVARIAVEQPAVKSLFMWDYGDPWSWLHPVRNDAMSPFVEEGVFTYAALFGGDALSSQPTRKPAYDGLLEGLQSAPSPRPAGDQRLTSSWQQETSWLTRSGVPNGAEFDPVETLELHPLDAETSQWSSMYWTVEPAEHGLVRLRNGWAPESGWLTRFGDQPDPTVNDFVPSREVRLASLDTSFTSQYWRLEPVGDGTWRLVNLWNPSSGVLTRNGNADGTAAGTVSLNPELGGVGATIDAQRWNLVPVAAASFDVDCDGQQTTADALAIVAYLVGLRDGVASCDAQIGDVTNLAAADVTSDGVVSVLDAIVTAQCISGQPTSFCPAAN